MLWLLPRFLLPHPDPFSVGLFFFPTSCSHEPSLVLDSQQTAIQACRELSKEPCQLPKWNCTRDLRKRHGNHSIPTFPTASFAAILDKENCNLGRDQSHVPLSSCPMTTSILLQLRVLPNFEVLPEAYQLNKAFNLHLDHLTIFFFLAVGCHDLYRV